MPDRGQWRFGAFEYDETAGAVRVGGEPVELDRSALAILLALMSNAGEAVDKDRLLEAGWPGRIVHENSLAKAIARLRRTLGEDGKRIEAVYGVGYRLNADAAAVAVPAAPSAEPVAARGRWLPRAAGLALLVALAAALALVWSRGDGAAADRAEGLKIGEPADVTGRVLWVDDHPENNRSERDFLLAHKVAVYDVTSSADALKLLAMYKYDAVISDMGRNGEPLAGIELVRTMRARGDVTPFYLYTILPSKAQRDLLAESGGQGVAVTPEGLYAFILPDLAPAVSAP